jgi:hypothetical protein
MKVINNQLGKVPVELVKCKCQHSQAPEEQGFYYGIKIGELVFVTSEATYPSNRTMEILFELITNVGLTSKKGE